MRKWILQGLAASFLVAGATSVIAAGDPVETRKVIMGSVGAAAGLGGGLMKGEIAYTPAAGKSVIATMNAAAHSFGSFFPEGSGSGDTTASPKIWEDAAGFEAAIAKFAETTNAAAAASGKDGPGDVDAFKAAMGPVFGNCKSCHEAFRVKK